MAKVEFNPVITCLRKRIGKLVFSHRKGKAYVKTYRKPRNPNTPGQRRVRGEFSAAIQAWRELPAADKRKWNERAKGASYSGYNLFLKTSLARLRRGLRIEG